MTRVACAPEVRPPAGGVGCDGRAGRGGADAPGASLRQAADADCVFARFAIT